MAYHARRKINNILQRLGLAFECGKVVAADGNCLFDSALAVIQDPEIRASLPQYAQEIFTINGLRGSLANFMRNNPILNSLAWFLQYKDATLSDERNAGISWDEYLTRVAYTKDYADQLQIMCLALFLNKDIMEVSEDSKVDMPWVTIPGQIEGWPYPVRPPAIRLGYLHRGEHFEPLKHKEPSQSSENKRKAQTTQLTAPKPTFTTPESPAKRRKSLMGSSKTQPLTCKQLSSDANSIRQNRSSKHDVACKLDSTTTLAKSPERDKEKCKVCAKGFQSLYSHLMRTKTCAPFYDMISMEAKHKETLAQRKHTRNAKYHQQNKEKILASKKESPRTKIQTTRYYKENKEQILASRKEYYKKNKHKIAEQRKIKFLKKTEKERFLDFHNEMRNVCCYGCICCHRILTNTKDNKIKGGIEGLERDLKKKSEHIFDKCLLKREELPKGLHDGQNFYLCSTCKRWLVEKVLMPPMAYKNGLGFDEIPPELKDLYELEIILISKGIIFLKVYQMPTSRWQLSKDRVVYVMIDHGTIQKTMQEVNIFPRLPDEAGLIPVDLKRKLEYDNVFKHRYINPDKMVKALTWLKQHNPRYSNIQIENRYPVMADDPPSGDDADSEAEEEALDCIRRNQFCIGGDTVLTQKDPQISAPTPLSKQGSKELRGKQKKIVVAPGEGKIPTSMLQDGEWVENGFPVQFPTGKFGLNYPRETKITPQQYFQQRLENIDKRCCKDPSFLFASRFHIELNSLQSAMNICFRRGKISNGKLTNLENATTIFDNQPGSDQYWQKRRFDILAKMDQLGPFHFFFTLSCADKRWDEVFVAILRQEGLQIIYKPAKQDNQDRDGRNPDGKFSYKKDDIFVKEKDKEVPLRDFLKDSELHEMIRKNVLTLTKIFDKRVRSFRDKIVMAPSNPIHAQYYHYRVEFQRRGAGHIHGVLWVDLEAIEKDNDKELQGLKTAMDKLRKQGRLTSKDKDVLSKFVDSFVTCSLKDDDIAQIVSDVQRHSHKGNWEKKTGCYKKGRNCRFNFPRFPSKKTIIAQPLLKEGMSEREFLEKKRKIKKILQDVKEVLNELSEDDQELFGIEDVLNQAKVKESEYYEALGVSQTGISIILKREVNEVYINNYNPEWLKAWDGNMDLSVCLDFFAIVTYITDYYTKTETSMMKEITAAAKACKARGDDMKATLRSLTNTFLKHREMGEMECYYRIIPGLHLSESNLKCVFVATGFPQNRSTIIRPVDANVQQEEGDEELEFGNGNISIEGSDKTFKMVNPIHKKYSNRPDLINNICLAQFAMSYETMPKRDMSKVTFVNGCSEEMSENEEMNIVSWTEQQKKPLPKIIQLKNGLGYMKLRSFSRAILRRHKMKFETNPHEFYYSQLLLFRPWRIEEKDLHIESLEECQNLFEESDLNACDSRTKIETTEESLFPYMNAVQEGRAMIATLDDQRPTHMGDTLDPQSVVENEEDEEQGLTEDEDHVGRFPTEALQKLGEPNSAESKGVFKMIPIPKDDSECEKMRAAAMSLDDDQMTVLNIFVKQVKQERASSPGNRPPPIFLIMHGGAGCGKSYVVNTVATVCEYWFRIQNPEMDDYLKPAVLKVAPTGKAATGIDGMTLHSAFNLPWGNQNNCLSDNVRQIKEMALSNLRVILLDEMSMVKPDQLYQLHMRLQEIKRNDSPFGGVSILLSGDLMQLPPVRSPQIFEPPKNEMFRRYDEISPLWDMYDTIELTHNHRQKSDWEYADMLNRIRINAQTEKDLQTLASRVSDERPLDAIYTFSERKMCREYNNKRLAMIPEKLQTMRAIHPRGIKVQSNEEGEVANTPFLQELQLKVGARIMLTYNVDTIDGLSNGTCGTVVGFVWSQGDNPEIIKVLVQFDNPRAGENMRDKHPRHPLHPRGSTPISRVSFEYGLGDPSKNHAAKTKVIQFPIQLAWAITAHKCQGMTIRPPTKLFADLDSCWTNRSAGMAYVMLGRIQNIDQLILKWSYDPEPKKDKQSEKKRVEDNNKAAKKINANVKAMEEANKMKQNSLNNPKNKKDNEEGLKITSLNIEGSLQSRLKYLKLDKEIYRKCDIICVQETGPIGPGLNLEGYTLRHCGGAHKRGVAVFLRDVIEKKIRKSSDSVISVSNEFYQCLKLSFDVFDLITVYRANKQTLQSSRNLVEIFEKGIDATRPTILCGDFNFDRQSQNDLTRMLQRRRFKQIVREPTTFRGNCIDHVYHNITESRKIVNYKLHYICYSDHEAVLIRISSVHKRCQD